MSDTEEIRTVYSDEEMSVALGVAIRLYREHFKMSRIDLSEKSGVSRNSIFRIENGGNTTVDTLYAVAQALNQSLSLMVRFAEKIIDDMEEADQ